MTIKILLKNINKMKLNYFNSTTKTGLKTGLRQDLVGLLNQLILYTLIFRLLDHYKEVLT